MLHTILPSNLKPKAVRLKPEAVRESCALIDKIYKTRVASLDRQNL
jgi:hypothetical protein